MSIASKHSKLTWRRSIFLMLLAFTFIIPVLHAQTFNRVTNLPAIYINTLDGADITSKVTYKYASMAYVDEKDSITLYDSMQIRGRGNSTWGMAKKPYRIKFKQKEKFLGKGYAKAKSWTLLANAADKTLIRNAVTSAMGEFAGLKFNPAFKFVDLFLNNKYQGTYQISDQVQVRPHRVNIEEQDYPLANTSNITGGYLLEVDGFADGNVFYTKHYDAPIRIHYPDEDEIVGSQKQYISEYINRFEQILAGESFTNAANGYRPWIDSTSLVNWFLCTEISGNIDGYYSTYFYKEQDDAKLYFGPLWDYDIAYNNDYRISGTQQMLMTDNGYGKTKMWINRMWEDPWFTQLVNRRYNELADSGLVEHMNLTIDSLVNLLDESQQRNYNRWGINTQVYHEIVLYSSYDRYISDLRSYIRNHFQWLGTAFSQRLKDMPTPDFVPENYYYCLLNNGSKKALDVDDDGKVVQNTNSDSHSQQWEIKNVEEGYYVLLNRSTGHALCDPTEGQVGPTINTGTWLSTAPFSPNDKRQQWALIPQSGNTYNLLNRHSQHVANLSGGSSLDGAHILSYTNDDRNATSNNRKWQINACEEITDKISETTPYDYALAYNSQTGQLHFGADRMSDLTFTVTIYNIGGQRVARFQAANGFSMRNLPKGIYIISWTDGNHIINRKIKI